MLHRLARAIRVAPMDLSRRKTPHVPAEPLIQWPEPIMEYVGFVAEFLAVGAIGFRYAAVRDRLHMTSRSEPRDSEREVLADACARAARIGLAGAVVWVLLFAKGLPAGAARAHTSVGGLLTGNLATGLQALLFVVGVLGLALAASRRHAGWPAAAVGLVLAPLTGVLAGQWSRLVNPVHRLVAGLWLGTLFILVVAGLVIVLRDVRVRDRRGAITADLVNGFSPLALTCGMIVVLTGLITAWRHLNPLSSLWTTPYGWALLVKLVLVAVVFALGAWNWKRVRPTLGSHDAADGIRRSSINELAAAALVLAVTAILVSLPSPRPPRPPLPPASPATPAPSGG